MAAFDSVRSSSAETWLVPADPIQQAGKQVSKQQSP